MSNSLRIKFKPTGQLFYRDLLGLSDSQLNSILEPIGLTIKGKKSFFFLSCDLYNLSDNQSMLCVGSSGIALLGPIDLVPSAEAILKLAKSLSLEVSDVHYSHGKFISGNTQPEPHHPSFDEEVSVLNGADCYLAYDGMEAPHPVSPVSGSSGSPLQIALNGPFDPLPTIKPIQKRAMPLVPQGYPPKFSYGNTQPEPHHPICGEEVTDIGLEEATKVKLPCPVIGSGGHKFKQIKCGSGMKDSRNLHDMIGIKIDENHEVFNIYVPNHVINKILSENHHFEVKNGKHYSVKRNIDRILTGNGGRATGYVNANADDYGYLFLWNGGNLSNASGLVLAGFVVNGNVTCADNGAFRNTGIPNVGMNNVYGGNRSRVRGINAGQNGHPMYNGNGNGGGNVPNGGSDMVPGDDFGNYISINRRLNEGNGVPSFTPVGHIVLLNGDGFCSLTHKVHCQWARYENKTPFEDGEVDAFTAWPGYRIWYMGTVEGYEIDGMVELEVPGWSWEVFADRLEEIIVERVDEEA